MGRHFNELFVLFWSRFVFMVLLKGPMFGERFSTTIYFTPIFSITRSNVLKSHISVESEAERFNNL